MLSIVFALFACSPHDLPASAEVTERVDLGEALRIAAPEVVGVTIDPDSGEILVLDAWEGLLRLDGSAVADPAHLITASDGMDRRPYTDAAALGGGLFAVTVRSDGLLFDAGTGVTVQHFCYEPAYEGDWEDNYQLTASLAYDPAADLLYAQPQTLGTADDAPISADVAQFDAANGVPLDWMPLRDRKFLAGALAIDASGDLFLGHEGRVHSYAFGDEEAEVLFDLGALDVGRIDGLAIDAATDDLWIVDGADQELIAISDWR